MEVGENATCWPVDEPPLAVWYFHLVKLDDPSVVPANGWRFSEETMSKLDIKPDTDLSDPAKDTELKEFVLTLKSASM